MKMLKEFMSTVNEKIVDITVDPDMKIATTYPRQQIALKIVNLAQKNDLKAALLDNHVRLKGSKKTIDMVLKSVIGKSSMGNAVVRDTSSPQIDKMLTKSLNRRVNESRSPRESLAIATVKQFIDKKGDMFAAGKEFDKKFGKKNVSYSDVQFPLYTIKIGSVKVYITNKKYMSGEDALAGKNKQIAIAI